MENRIKYLSKDLINKLISESEFSMNSLSIQIPFSYALELANISWNDFLFAVQNGYFDNASAIDYDVILLDKGEENERILDLACINPLEITKEILLREYLVEFAAEVSEQEKEDTEDKIMYVLLKLVFDNKDIFEDPLSVVEVIYDDFNFPKSIEDFVLYMPSEEHVHVTLEQGLKQMYDNWEKYLYSQISRFRPAE